MKKHITAMMLAGLLGLSLAAGGCGAGAGETTASQETSSAASDSFASNAADEKLAVRKSADSAPAEGAADDADMDSGSTDSSGMSTGTVKSQNQKIIYTYNYTTETKEFDSFYEKVTAKTETLGGYVENSETNGSVSDGVNRYAHMTLRIPADKMEQLTSMLDEESNVTYRSRSSENVTLQYADMEIHVKALRTEQETLLRLLEKAEKLKDIIALQSQLTQVRYEIESYESQLRMYDNLIDYSTIYLDVYEVERTTSVTPVRASFFQEVSDRFSDNLYAVGQWLRSAAVWIISSLPMLVPLGIAAAVLLRILWKRFRGRGLRKAALAAEPQEQDKDNVKDEDKDADETESF